MEAKWVPMKQFMNDTRQGKSSTPDYKCPLELELGVVWVKREGKWFQTVKVGMSPQVGTANELWPAAPLTTILHPHRPQSRTRFSQRESRAPRGSVDSGQLGPLEFSFPCGLGEGGWTFPFL